MISFIRGFEKRSGLPQPMDAMNLGKGPRSLESLDNLRPSPYKAEDHKAGEDAIRANGMPKKNAVDAGAGNCKKYP